MIYVSPLTMNANLFFYDLVVVIIVIYFSSIPNFFSSMYEAVYDIFS